ncbi:3-phenylpropionate/trans-cinnamate dioxygenase ferredoxin reductase subunit [Fontimonas thermophila]|uniref:3-phenylpropionate/trans-cinnamate dioxygenase ferredoxin reductase subunit n=1 Tax=Fontimonas thermophila TaxID=1076937 RepID=A0A1I2HE75_9GAMM|nr:FAD-dependent oxidoreductase [Fontimonas thermophila]SFF26851.1 3-phenylpropionate/trans-cinnamate dioxygenase ferredoxin reductase subunit [Fontimonas thermophila]
MTQAKGTVLIIGGGQAGAETAVELRKLGHDGRILIVGEEPFLPYKRPPLSKAYLAGDCTETQLYMMQAANLEKAGIEYHGGVPVTRIDRAAHTVERADGTQLRYDKLVLATGGRARPLPVPGADKPNVFLLRTIADVQKIRAHCQPGKRVAIVGGGFIGLEAAAVLVKKGLAVTVLEGLPRVLARVTCPQVSAFFERVHRQAGVDLRTGVQVAGFDGDAEVKRVCLSDGSTIETDFVVVGIGLIPNTELAASAGLAVDNGIVVDEYTRTADPDIYAAGDCTHHPSRFLGRYVRLESVQNAMEQGRAAARNIMGRQEPYQMVPWFWSDQYDLKLQMVGISSGYDQLVLRGDPATQRHFAVFYLKNGRIIAADTVSRPQEFMLAKKLVAENATVDPARLADETLPLKTLVG